MDANVINKAIALKNEIQRACVPHVKLYRSGTMRSSVNVIEVGNDKVMVILPVSYASYTNSWGRNKGWIEAAKEIVDMSVNNGTTVEIIEGASLL